MVVRLDDDGQDGGCRVIRKDDEEERERREREIATRKNAIA